MDVAFFSLCGIVACLLFLCRLTYHMEFFELQAIILEVLIGVDLLL